MDFVGILEGLGIGKVVDDSEDFYWKFGLNLVLFFLRFKFNYEENWYSGRLYLMSCLVRVIFDIKYLLFLIIFKWYLLVYKVEEMRVLGSVYLVVFRIRIERRSEIWLRLGFVVFGYEIVWV